MAKILMQNIEPLSKMRNIPKKLLKILKIAPAEVQYSHIVLYFDDHESVIKNICTKLHENSSSILEIEKNTQKITQNGPQ